MKIYRVLSILVLMVTFSVLFNACSKYKPLVEPVIDNPQEMSQNISDILGTEDNGRKILAVYKCVIDPDAKTFTIEPANRNGEIHFPLSNLRNYTIHVMDWSFYPNFWADIKLVHPFVGSGIEVFDPRIIAILNAYPGVSMNYPISDVHANNAVFLEPDGYTKLFDSVNPAFDGNANPFMAYFKDEPYRVWSSVGVSEETQRWQMDIHGFDGEFEFEFVIDVSTNGYGTPIPIIDNAPEPVQITAEIGDGLTPTGGSADIDVTLLDWQGYLGIGRVQVEAPDLFIGTVDLTYLEPGPNPDEYVFTGSISNDLLAPSGKYHLLVSASDQQTGINIYNERSVEF